MSETRYIISDAAKMIDVEPHVLRYWEEELEMDIPRNEMGHRYYTDREVRLFTQVRDLKDKGFQLKAIKMILTTVSEDMSSDNIISLEDVRKNYEDVVDEDTTETQVDILNPEDKMKQFKYIMESIVMQALKKNNTLLEEGISEKVIKEMDYLVRMKEEREEERFRILDEAIRKKQKGHKEAAAAKVPAYALPRKKKRWFMNKDPF